MRIQVDEERVDALTGRIQQMTVEEDLEPPVPVGEELPEMMQAFALRPDIVDAMLPLQRILYLEGQIDRELLDKLFVRVSRLNECQFCTAAHTAALNRVGIDDSPATDREAVALDYAEQVTEDANRVGDTLFARLQEQFTDEEIIELTLAIGLISLLNKFNNALNIRYENPTSTDDR
ncbi:MAG: carboxymuconolactone decarboxylase family protein [Haloarcula sp.]